MIDYKPTPINYLGKKAPYVHLFDELMQGGGARRFCDFTSGSQSVPLYMVERRGARELILNDVSSYPRLLAHALFGGKPMPKAHVIRAVYPLHAAGYLFKTDRTRGPWKGMSDEAAVWIDGFCLLNAERPLMLTALSCVLTDGAPRFSQIVGKHIVSLNPERLRDLTMRRASKLVGRQYGSLLDTSITSSDYLDVPFTEPPFDDLEGFVCYLDPAWPTQPGHKTIDNKRAYGLYAQTVMSVLLQADQPMPAEYDVTEPDFYAGMRKTIDGCLAAGAMMLVAYQTTEERVEQIRAELFAGLIVDHAHADKNVSSTLREYLFRVRS